MESDWWICRGNASLPVALILRVDGWLAARQEAPNLSEEDARDALARLDPLWEELFPAE
jgi:hypothetical protein